MYRALLCAGVSHGGKNGRCEQAGLPEKVEESGQDLEQEKRKSGGRAEMMVVGRAPQSVSSRLPGMDE